MVNAIVFSSIRLKGLHLKDDYEDDDVKILKLTTTSCLR